MTVFKAPARLPALALGALLASGCGSGDRIVINGAGATFPNIIYQKWAYDYNRITPGVEINYQSIGSGGGIAQFSGGTVDFGGTDAPLTENELAAVNGNALHIPTVLGAVIPTYNLPGVTETLRFTPDILADIYLGRIVRWNDPRMAAANPGVSLPDHPIVVVHRSDGSGTTFVWVDYLTKVSADWAGRVGRGKAVNWPVGIGGRGNEGVAAVVSQTAGAIGYVELGYAEINDMPRGIVQNRAGHFVPPTTATITAAAAGAMAEMGADTDLRVSITDPAGPDDAFPISSFTWVLVQREFRGPRDRGRALADFLWWAITSGQADAPSLGYAPLPSEMQPWIADRLRQITVDGQPVWDGPPSD